MNIATKFSLMRRAVVLFPRADYLDEATVRHARRGWVASRMTLGSKWILDKQVARLQ